MKSVEQHFMTLDNWDDLKRFIDVLTPDQLTTPIVIDWGCTSDRIIHAVVQDGYPRFDGKGPSAHVRYFYLAGDDFDEDGLQYQEGSIYKKTGKGDYLIYASLYRDTDNAFLNRQGLIREQTLRGVQKKFDYHILPHEAVEISKRRVNEIVAEWKRVAKQLRKGVEKSS